MNKKWRVLFIAILEVVVLGLGGLQVAHAATTTTVPGKGTPSASATSVMGVYMNTGFSLQPEDQYVVINKATTLTTATGHSVLDAINLLASDHFQWYSSADKGATWAKVTTGITANLTVTPTTLGTTYYQQSFQYYSGLMPPILGATTYYSRVAAVTAVAAPIPATKLDVTAASDYLYNNQSTAMTTTVDATPTPADATGHVTWGSDNTDLASVDSTTGVVTANTSGKSGTVTITGTMTNDDGSTVIGSTKITIGGGLNDQTTDEGKTATFDIQGDFNGDPSAIVWHKVDSSGNDTVVASGTDRSYTTPVTTASDDKATYYAVLTMGTGTTAKTITTNKATLNVTINRTPNVTVKTSVENLTDNSGNTATAVTNIINGDTVKISGTVTENNVNSNLNDADFLLKVPSNINNTILTIDGKNHSYYPASIDGESYIVASGLNFGDQKSHTFSFQFDSMETENMTAITKVEFQGYDSSNTMLDTFSGDDITLGFTDGQLQATAHDVDFGTLTYDNVNREVTGNVVDGDDLLSVTDNRRDKTAMNITLQQKTPFSDGSHDMAATLSYDDGDGLLPLSTDAQIVASSTADAPVPSLGTSTGASLKLRLANAGIVPGNYVTVLTWTITDAPS
ncbi:hypothetical protein [Levilactobacillus fujinensis]|uniref:BIG2 domain-containing protein n=1 Tax=Levilactobacillus fujinensis TaxID=2486024 RepID=A0ABW1TGZ2_9LACO|nr:hypothetical protein [Levilactobacillus fujinensis]